MTISKSVGQGGQNEPADVTKVLGLLVRHRQWVGFDLRQTKTQTVDANFIKAIEQFQLKACSYLAADGKVDPNGFTYKRLSLAMIMTPSHKVFNNVCWNPGDDLKNADFDTAATTLGCETAAIKAVAEVETKRGANDEMGRPTILFERHKFRRFTSGAYNTTHPDLSNSQGGYGRFSAQYPKLYRAAVLDETAALKSASWGAFQIMGFNHQAAGYRSVAAFVDAMIGSQANQLGAFVSFINADAGMKKAIQDKNWATFARKYNGPKYAENSYDTKMATAYAKFVAAEAKPAAEAKGN